MLIAIFTTVNYLRYVSLLAFPKTNDAIDYLMLDEDTSSYPSLIITNIFTKGLHHSIN